MKRWVYWICICAALTACFSAGVFVGDQQKREIPVSSAASAILSPVNPIEAYRTERQQMRQMQISQLNDLIYGGKADSEIIAMAQRRLLDLMEWSEQETTLEGVLRIRGLEDVVVTVHEDSVSVLVKGDVVTQQQTAIILDLILRETGISGGNVKIIPIN